MDYIVFKDGRIGTVDICTCVRCRERKQAELFINNLDGSYMDCIKTNDVENIVYIGDSLTEATVSLAKHFNLLLQTKNKELSYLQSVINFYEKQLIIK
jgi:hypothetical protein